MNEEQSTSKQPVFHISEVNSLLDLQTEFLKKKKEVTSKSTYNKNIILNPTKNNIFAVSKTEKAEKKLIRNTRTARIEQNAAELKKEEEERIRRQKILEEKAVIYERMSKGERLDYGDGNEVEFLVDFQIKKRELEEKRDLEFSLKPSTSDTAEVEKKVAPLIVHYDHTEEKGRVFGPSHVSLVAPTEEERLKNIEALKNLTAETNINRQKRKLVLNEKKMENRSRLNRIRARKGLPPLESSSSDEDDEEKESESTGNVDLDEIPLPSSTTTTEAKKPRMEPQPVKYGVEREWDRGKIGYNRWVKAQRDVRDEEFKPPSFYYDK